MKNWNNWFNHNNRNSIGNEFIDGWSRASVFAGKVMNNSMERHRQTYRDSVVDRLEADTERDVSELVDGDIAKDTAIKNSYLIRGVLALAAAFVFNMPIAAMPKLIAMHSAFATFLLVLVGITQLISAAGYIYGIYCFVQRRKAISRLMYAEELRREVRNAKYLGQ